MQKKGIEVEQNSDKDGKVFHKSMSNGLYGKAMEKFRNGVDVIL